MRTASRSCLRARGIGPGDHFGVLMENTIHYLPLVWGAQRAGTMMVPVSTRLTAPEICYILGDAGVKLLITSRAFDDRIADMRAGCSGMEFLIVGGEGEEDYEAALDAQPAEPIADQAPGQYMLYSSGTTGAPKGVRPAPPESDDILAPNPLVGLAVMGAGMPADGSMVYLSPAPLYHAAPLGWCTTAHRLGGTVVVMEHFEPQHALETIEKYKVTDSQWVPTHFVRMLKLEPQEREGIRPLQPPARIACRRALPCPDQARDDRMVGADHQRILCR